MGEYQRFASEKVERKIRAAIEEVLPEYPSIVRVCQRLGRKSDSLCGPDGRTRAKILKEMGIKKVVNR